MYGTIYRCNHELYNSATLYRIKDKGLCVIQQRFDTEMKVTWWTEIDKALVDKLYLNENFYSYFEKHSSEEENGIYPTVTVRQIMHGLKMKPLRKEKWETVFDHCPI